MMCEVLGTDGKVRALLANNYGRLDEKETRFLSWCEKRLNESKGFNDRDVVRIDEIWAKVVENG